MFQSSPKQAVSADLPRKSSLFSPKTLSLTMVAAAQNEVTLESPKKYILRTRRTKNTTNSFRSTFRTRNQQTEEDAPAPLNLISVNNSLVVKANENQEYISYPLPQKSSKEIRRKHIYLRAYDPKKTKMETEPNVKAGFNATMKNSMVSKPEINFEPLKYFSPSQTNSTLVKKPQPPLVKKLNLFVGSPKIQPSKKRSSGVDSGNIFLN